MTVTPRRYANLRDITAVLIAAAMSALVLHTGWAVYTDQPLLWQDATPSAGTPMASDAGGAEGSSQDAEPSAEPAPAPGAGERDTDDGTPDAAPADEAAGRPAVPYDHAAEVEAALASLLTNDDGTRYATAGRWRQDTVTVSVSGDQATGAVLDEIDEALVWMSDASGLLFVRVGHHGGDIDVTVDRDKLARARQRLEGDTIVSASATWNTSYEKWRVRWMWEELVHTTGPVGDYGPAGTLFNSDMHAGGPTDYDRWLVQGLYAADGTSPAQLRAWYEANPRQ